MKCGERILQALFNQNKHQKIQKVGGQSPARYVAEVSLLAALLSLTGLFKIPSFFPGAEFQLSSPLSVAICVVYGFKQYLAVGFLASFIGLALGMQNIFNVLVACVFRLVAGIVVACGRGKIGAVLLAGPLGTVSARICLALVMDVAAYPLILASLPGMVYTAAFVLPLIKVLQRVRKNR